MAAERYGLHGLVVESAFPLSGNRLPAGPAVEPDVVIRRSDAAPVPDRPPEGDLIAVERHPPYSFYIAQRADGYVVRYGSTCDLRMSTDGREVAVVLDPCCDDDLASVMLSASGVSCSAMLLGHCVLHASGVVVDGRAVLSLGDPQTGKTTLAAELALAGAALLSDDAVRVSVRDSTACAYPAANLLRLRPHTAEALKRYLPPGARASTAADGRVTLRPARVALGDAPVAALLINCPDASHDDLRLEPVDRRSALLEAVRHMRTAGFTDGRLLRGHFDHSHRLAQAVPFYRLHRPPWPLPPGAVLDRLRELLS